MKTILRQGPPPPDRLEEAEAAPASAIYASVYRVTLIPFAPLFGAVAAFDLIGSHPDASQAQPLAALALMAATIFQAIQRDMAKGRVRERYAEWVVSAAVTLGLITTAAHLVWAPGSAATQIALIAAATSGMVLLKFPALLGATLTSAMLAAWVFLRAPWTTPEHVALTLAGVAVVWFTLGVARHRAHERATIELKLGYEQELRSAEGRYQGHLQRLNEGATRPTEILKARGEMDGLWEWDLRTDKMYFSPRWRALLGYDRRLEISRIETWFNLIHSCDLDEVMTRLRAHLDSTVPAFECEHRIRQADGTYRWVLSYGRVVRDADGKANRLCGSQIDIKRMKNYEQQLVHQATHDRLTGLPNRQFLIERLREEQLACRHGSGHVFAVAFLDLDRFKYVNDTLGHSAGDQLLTEVARRLRQAARGGDVVARLGGDEFVILMRGLSTPEAAVGAAERFKSALAPVVVIDGEEVTTNASIGVAIGRRAEDSPEEMLRLADIAMYQAKNDGKGRVRLFDAKMQRRMSRHFCLQNDLEKAMRNNEFQLYYQPLISLTTGRIIAAEALLRWVRSNDEIISPKEFIPIAEETGMIAPLGAWVLREACRQRRSWQDSGLEPIVVSVNVSGRQLAQPEFLHDVRSAIQDSSLEEKWLQLEVTESVLVSTGPRERGALDCLSTSGVRLAIDDFGTGYSSFAALRELRCHTLKMDRSFLFDVSTDRRAAALANSIITMARNLELGVVAEGVENGHQLEFLKGTSCDFMQGYLASMPVPADRFTDYLKEGRLWCQESAIVTASGYY